MPNYFILNFQRIANLVNVPIMRRPKLTAFINILISGLIKMQDDDTVNYLGGVTFASWSGIVNYNLGDRVTISRNSYECIKPCLNVYVLNTGYWYKILSDNIGLTERLNYNAQKMQLEYVLNKRFNNISSILPPYGMAQNNIFIVTNPSISRIAWRGANNAISSYVKPQPSNNFYYHTKGTPNINYFNYTIWVPSAILINLGANTLNSEQIIKAETNKYNNVGLTFNVQHY